MTSNIVTVLAVVAGIAWLGVMLVAALRNRGGEEVAPNLRPGIDDQQLETRRLENGQKFAIAASAFLAISLPLYFLTEVPRQEDFVEQFHEESVERGEEIVEEFGCFACHGPLGVGGTATFVEKRSGVTVAWTAPSLDDIFYRYDEDEVNFWITYGRGNTPMPPWGLAGGGSLNVSQVQDVVNYLKTIQIPQSEAVARVSGEITAQIARLDNADATVEEAILNQRQVIAELEQAPADADFILPIGKRAKEVLEGADTGLDTDADGLSDFAEVELTRLSAEAVDYFTAVEAIELDPSTPDAEKLDEALAQLEFARSTDPILDRYLEAIQGILAEDEGEDTDGDGISDEAEQAISGQMAEASAATVPSGIATVVFDPADPESSGQPDLAAARALVGGMESVAITTRVAKNNQEKLLSTARQGRDFLVAAQQAKAWEIDISGVAESMGVSFEEAQRAVALFNASCARCHTAGFSAGVPYTQEVGSGGFGPALWDGRPVIQFGEATGDPVTDLLIQFLIKGSEAQKPYGINGFGSGRMPG
ncbi:MAG TPA: cytochrome c, partial [Acidimicrobiia bacterium]|nr:cytochrome c [Acidimicrobiia bacterium]